MAANSDRKEAMASSCTSTLPWDPIPVLGDGGLDFDIDVPMQRPADGLGIPHRVHQGEVPFHDEVAVVPRGGGLADLQAPEQLLELLGLGQIVVVLQRGEPQGLAEAARAQQQKLLADLLDGSDAIGAVDVEIAFFGDGLEVGETVGKAHAVDSLGWRN